MKTRTERNTTVNRGETYGAKVKLRPKRFSDVQTDYAWQCDPELARLDASSVLTMPFSEYLLSYAYQLQNPPLNSSRFSIETHRGKHIGNCTYYNADWPSGEAEIGIMIGDRDYWGRGYGTDAVAVLVEHIFGNTRIKRLHLKTLQSNTRAQRCFGKCGFTRYGCRHEDGHDFMLMELTREKWQERSKQQGEHD